MGIAPGAWHALFLCLHECRARAAKRVENQIVGCQAERRKVLADQMRRVGKNEAIPAVNGCVVGLEGIDGSVPARDWVWRDCVHSSTWGFFTIARHTQQDLARSSRPRGP